MGYFQGKESSQENYLLVFSFLTVYGFFLHIKTQTKGCTILIEVHSKMKINEKKNFQKIMT